jgi:manganese/zinc/iron transport system permease protein
VMMSVLRTTRIKDDTALGTILSVFFGFGLVLLTFIQKLPTARQAGLDKFLFGQAATLLTRDVVQIVALGAGVLLMTALFWKEFKLLSFDPLYGASLGFPMRLIDGILTSLLVMAIVLGLQTVGVVLMSAMVVAPAAAARQWTDRLSLMVLLSALFGAAAGVGGAIVSSTTTHLPTGPTIVLIATAFVIFSVLFAPHRGVVSTWIRNQKNRRVLQTDTVLGNMLILARQHEDANHAHATSVIKAMSTDSGGVDRTLRELQQRGLVAKNATGAWSLTHEGRREAEEDERQHTGVRESTR